MQDAAHTARLVAAHSALLALLIDQQGENVAPIDGVTASFRSDPDMGFTFDVIYTAKGVPMAGEGI